MQLATFYHGRQQNNPSKFSMTSKKGSRAAQSTTGRKSHYSEHASGQQINLAQRRVLRAAMSKFPRGELQRKRIVKANKKQSKIQHSKASYSHNTVSHEFRQKARHKSKSVSHNQGKVKNSSQIYKKTSHVSADQTKKSFHSKAPLRCKCCQKENTPHEPIVTNKQLLQGNLRQGSYLSTFLSQVSHLFDLVLLEADLPEPAERLLQPAILALRSLQTKSEYSIPEQIKIFKEKCMLIYHNSEQKQLQSFLYCALPIRHRWWSCNPSKRDSRSLQLEHRSRYYHSLSRKVHIIDSNESNVLQRIQSKINNYLNKTQNAPAFCIY